MLPVTAPVHMPTTLAPPVASEAPTAPPAEPIPTDASTTTAAATTTSPPTGPQIEVFESRCGSVTADLAPTPPVIVEIVPVGGYRYRIEDPDDSTITVQFTGGGEDCEVKVGGAEHPAEGHDDAHDG